MMTAVNAKQYQMIGWIPVAAWCGLIFWMSSQSDLQGPDFPLPPYTDKVVHAFIYAILSALTYPLARTLGMGRTGAAALAIVFASLYGVSDEWHQSYVAGRHADLRDWIADTIGACTVCWIAFREDRLRKWLLR